MGYEYTVRGWLKAHEATHLAQWFEQLKPRLSASAAYAVEHAPQWFTVGGDRGNYLSFATESTSAHLGYLEYLSLLAAEVAPCTGLLTITGEWLVDGRGQFVIVEDGSLRSVPLGHLLDVASPWRALYRAIHYMGRDELPMRPPAELSVEAALAGRDSVKGWFHWEYDARRADPAAVAAPYLKRWDPRVAASVGFQCQYGHDCMVIGQDGVDAAALAARLAEMSADFPDSWGVLYASDAAERVQQPLAVQGGKLSLLPEVRLRDLDDPLLVPYEVSKAYAGLGTGYVTLHLKWNGDLDGLAPRVAAALDATPGSLRRREDSDIGGPLYLMDVPHHTLALVRNHGQDPSAPPPAEHAYALFLFADHAAPPDSLPPMASDAAARLRAAGLDAWVE